MLQFVSPKHFAPSQIAFEFELNSIDRTQPRDLSSWKQAPNSPRSRRSRPCEPTSRSANRTTFLGQLTDQQLIVADPGRFASFRTATVTISSPNPRHRFVVHQPAILRQTRKRSFPGKRSVLEFPLCVCPLIRSASANLTRFRVSVLSFR